MNDLKFTTAGEYMDHLTQLKQQAGIADNPDPEGLDLFARLIVEECCEVLGKESIIHSGYGYNQHGLYQKLYKHFNLER
ncbi:hypothetical protein UFOVP328_190 [uncultured Caudovirales phage]|uniref:Uncharacterized protein n=1 Tax=uncultured Caudovirales phage TaxID=2100421 RepID=A0A6J5LY55_9CAUD|nr:hypothetical protein UFOVP328_190 [uncultured Caudovirales phage]